MVTWALGHLVTLADPEAYDAKYKAWEMKDLPMMPEKFQLVVIKQTGRQYQTVKIIFTGRTSVILLSRRTRDGRVSWWPAGFWQRPEAVNR